MLDVAKQKLMNRAEFREGRAEDLPFSDNEFDIVTLITALEFTEDPQKAISEAIRVCRGRIFLGVMNKYSFIGVNRRLQGLIYPSVYNNARFFHISKLTAMVRHHSREFVSVGAASFFTLWMVWFCKEARRVYSGDQNPFGAFFGLSFSVTFSYTTIQEPFGKASK